MLEERLEDAIAEAESRVDELFAPVFQPAFDDLDNLLAEYRFTGFSEYFRYIEALGDPALELDAVVWAHLVQVRDGESGRASKCRDAEPATFDQLAEAVPFGSDDDFGETLLDDQVHRRRVDLCADRLREQFKILDEQHDELIDAARHGRPDDVPHLVAQIRHTVTAMTRTRALWMRHLAHCWPPGLDRSPEDVLAAYATTNAFAEYQDAV
jgi:hypothetical protein